MSKAEIRIAFGMDQTNRVVHISEVERGRACDCRCPACSGPLMAVQGQVRQHHFRHAVEVACEGALESGIHLAAKQIIIERKELTLPKYVVTSARSYSKGRLHRTSEEPIPGGTVQKFDSVAAEVEVPGMRADILAMIGDRPLMVEIRYRHPVDEEKRAKIVAANISAIEIDLSDVSVDEADWPTLWSRINDPARILWLHNAEEEHAFRERQVQKKQRLQNAIQDMAELSAPARVEELGRQAEHHHIWQDQKGSLPFAWNELPAYLNVAVPDGDWIYGCDRRIWQIALYSYFVCERRTPFSVARVDEWLQSTVGLNVPSCVKTINRYSVTCREMVPAARKDFLPGPRNTLDAYFRVLCKIGTLAPWVPPWGPHSEFGGDRSYSVRIAEPAASVNQQGAPLQGSSLARPRLPMEARVETPSHLPQWRSGRSRRL